MKNILSKIESFNSSWFLLSLWSIDLRLDPNDNCISLENSLFEKAGLFSPKVPPQYRWLIFLPATCSVIARCKVFRTYGGCPISEVPDRMSLPLKGCMIKFDISFLRVFAHSWLCNCIFVLLWLPLLVNKWSFWDTHCHLKINSH